MIMDQRLFGVLDRTLDCLQLLRDLCAGAALLDHKDNGLQMAVGALQTANDSRVMFVRHWFSPRFDGDNGDPTGRIDDAPGRINVSSFDWDPPRA
jgi:hypothetical protein